MKHAPFVALLSLAASGLGVVPARPSSDQCQAGRNDRVERPAPEALLPRLGRAFDVAPDALRHGSYIRCADGKLLGCMVGANIVCGQADASRRSAGADAFCRENPNAEIVPMSATGHATVYDWHCAGTHAAAGKSIGTIDALGFLAGNWRPVR